MDKTITVVVADGNVVNIVCIPEGTIVKIISADLESPTAKIYQASGKYEVRNVTEDEAADFLGEEDSEYEYECPNCGWTGAESELKVIVGDRGDCSYGEIKVCPECEEEL